MNTTLDSIGPLNSIQTCPEHLQFTGAEGLGEKKKTHSDQSFMEFTFLPNNPQHTIGLHNI